LVSSVRNALAIGGETQAAIALTRPSLTPDEPDPMAATRVRA
jgi:hypothetical protein